MTLKRGESARHAETDEGLMPRLDRLPQPLTAWLGATAEAVGSLKNPTVLIHLPSTSKRHQTAFTKRMLMRLFIFRSQQGLIDSHSNSFRMKWVLGRAFRVHFVHRRNTRLQRSEASYM